MLLKLVLDMLSLGQWWERKWKCQYVCNGAEVRRHIDNRLTEAIEVTGNERILPGKGHRKTRPKAEDLSRRNRNPHRKAMGEKGGEGSGEAAVGTPRRSWFIDGASREPFSIFLQIIWMVKVL